MLRSGVLFSVYFISTADCSWGSYSGSRKEGRGWGCWCQNRTECEGCSASCTCPSGCQPGHWGPACRHLCPRGQYGVNCSQRCGHCRYNRCNPVTGTCPVGCLPQWTGSHCHINCSHSQNLCWRCVNCQSSSATCDEMTGPCHKQGCPRLPDTSHFCHSNNTCQRQPCTCGACLGGVENCDVSSGVCVKGCQPLFTGKSCTQSCQNSQMSKYCQHNTCQEQCPCGCDRVTYKCMPCNASQISESQAEVGAAKDSLPSLWSISPWSTCLSVLILVTISITLVYRKALQTSTRRRDKHLQYVLNQLTSNTSFRQVRTHHQEQEEGEPHGSPCFDMNTICQVGHKAVLQELDSLLGQNESYEHFRKSFRYREFRLAVANKIWATENQRRLSVGKNNSSNDSLLAKTKNNLKIRIGIPLELAGESRMEVDESFPPSSILKEGNAGEDAMLADKSRHTVRFSSATSLVIFSTSSSSSVTGSTMPDSNSV